MLRFQMNYIKLKKRDNMDKVPIWLNKTELDRISFYGILRVINTSPKDEKETLFVYTSSAETNYVYFEDLSSSLYRSDEITKNEEYFLSTGTFTDKTHMQLEPEYLRYMSPELILFCEYLEEGWAIRKILERSIPKILLYLQSIDKMPTLSIELEKDHENNPIGILAIFKLKYKDLNEKNNIGDTIEDIIATEVKGMLEDYPNDKKHIELANSVIYTFICKKE